MRRDLNLHKQLNSGNNTLQGYRAEVLSIINIFSFKLKYVDMDQFVFTQIEMIDSNR